MSHQRYFIKFSYNGKHYNGWQKQPNAPSVQSKLEEAINKILKSAITIVGAGRTDTGVHAQKMFAHFDIDFELPKDMTYRLNAFLPKDIAVKKILKTTPLAHARFDALYRTYEYHLVTFKNVFLNNYAYYYPYELDVSIMNQASKLLLNEKHFKCFSKSNTDVKTDLCKVSQASWSHQGERLVFTITSDRFLRNMVRAIVGTLLDIGRHKTTIKEFKNIIESKDRCQAGFSVPPDGLYLTEIMYPSELFYE